MSYARFSEADVYVFLSCDRALECCLCALAGDCTIGATFKCVSTAAMVSHLEDHLGAGHHVPTYTFDELKCDAWQNDHYIATGEWLDVPTTAHTAAPTAPPTVQTPTHTPNTQETP